MLKNILNQIINQNRSIKRLIVIINDGLISVLAFSFISLLLDGYMLYEVSFFIFQIAIICFFILFRIYDNVIKHLGGSYIYKLLIALFIPHFCYFLYLQIFPNNLNYGLIIMFNFFVTFSLIVTSRMFAKSILYQSPHKTENIAIYVDQNYSSAIIDSINHLNQYSTVAIISDDKKSKGLYINGVEVSAAIKNIFSMAVGAAKGLCSDNVTEKVREKNYLNTSSALIKQSVHEMEIFVEHLKGKKETVKGLAGLGDLYVSSGGGRNAKMGSYIGEGLTFSEAKKTKMEKVTVEGADLAKEIAKKVNEDFDKKKLPLMLAMINAIVDDKKLELDWESFR